MPSGYEFKQRLSREGRPQLLLRPLKQPCIERARAKSCLRRATHRMACAEHAKNIIKFPRELRVVIP
jgi:hypothetical protein